MADSKPEMIEQAYRRKIEVDGQVIAPGTPVKLTKDRASLAAQRVEIANIGTQAAQPPE